MPFARLTQRIGFVSIPTSSGMTLQLRTKLKLEKKQCATRYVCH